MSEFPLPEHEGGWRKNDSPDFQRAQGFDPDALEAFGRYNLAVPNNAWRPWSEHKGCLVIKNGWIVGEWYEGEDFAQLSPVPGIQRQICDHGLFWHPDRRQPRWAPGV